MKDGARTEEVLEQVGPVGLTVGHASAWCRVAPDLHQQTERRIISSDPSRTKSQGFCGQHLLVFGDLRTMMLTYTHGLHGASTAAEVRAWILRRLLLTYLFMRVASMCSAEHSLGSCPLRKARRAEQRVPPQAQRGWVKRRRAGGSDFLRCMLSFPRMLAFLQQPPLSRSLAKGLCLLPRRWKGKGTDQAGR